MARAADGAAASPASAAANNSGDVLIMIFSKDASERQPKDRAWALNEP
jgi:hypothetical protein